MRKTVCLVLAGLLVAAMAFCACARNDLGVQRVDKDTVKGWLGQPDVVIIDVRAPSDWAASDKKIQGAVRQDPGNVAAWAGEIPKDKRIILYCA
jgi:rhodanese-related sulfurtransferase